MGLLGRLKWLVVLAIPVVIIGLAALGAASIRMPVPTAQHEECLQKARLHHANQADCETYEPLLKGSLSDPVAYYTAWLTIFTAVLAAVGVAQGFLIFDQIKLGRDEFTASHRPWIAIRDARLVRHPHMDAKTITVEVEYSLENTSDVPALDVALSGVLCPVVDDRDVIRLRDAAIANYKSSLLDGRRPQNQVAFPGEKPPYPGELTLNHGEANLSATELKRLLLIAAFVYESSIGGRRSFHYSSAVYWIELPIEEGTLNSALAGTGHLLNWKMGRYHIGWGAE